MSIFGYTITHSRDRVWLLLINILVIFQWGFARAILRHIWIEAPE